MSMDEHLPFSSPKRLAFGVKGAIQALALLAAFSALAGFAGAVRQAPAIIENDHRLAPTFALAHGHRLYYGSDEGPVLSTIYGPVTAIAYMPALLASTPMAAVRLATLLSIVMFFVPMLLVAGKTSTYGYVCAFGLATAVASLSVPLSKSSILVHADAPALAAGGIACWVSAREELNSAGGGALRPWLAGTFAAVAVMAKQNMAPLTVALLIWWIFDSRRGGLAFGAAAALSLLAIWGGIFTVSSSPGAAWFNWFQIPAHQPYNKASLFPVADELSRTLLLYVLAASPALWKFLRPANGPGWTSRFRRPEVLFLFVGCCLIPTSILGRIKAGGSDNALSPAIYFFALASMSELWMHLFPHKGLRSRSSLVALTLVIGTCVAVKLPENLYSLFARPAETPMERVYNFAVKHPGQVYFPQFPLTILMAEGHLYDFSWGLSDRAAAGRPVAEARFLRDTPAQTGRMALVDWVPYWEKDIYSRCKTSLQPAPQFGPGFSVCDYR
jgi:hypothetical protein